MTDEVFWLSELSHVHEIIDNATSLQDIFGTDPNKIGPRFCDLITVLQQFLPREQTTAGKLGIFYDRAKEAVANGTYEQSIPLYDEVRFKVSGSECVLKKPLTKTPVANEYYGTYIATDGTEREAVIKMANSANEAARKANSDALRTEARTLKELWKDREEPNLRHLPELLSQFAYSTFQVNVLSSVPGYDMYKIQFSPYHIGGMSDIHIAWVMNRILTTLGFVHDSGFIHGGLTPKCLIVTPEDHNVTITDWTHAVRAGGKIIDRHPIYNPADEDPTPSTDLFALGKCIIYLSGGDPVTGRINSQLPDEFRSLLKWMILESPLQRPRDAYALSKDLREIRSSLHGVRRFFPTSV